MKKMKKVKEQILNSLSGKFEVTKVEKDYFDNGVYIICEFMNRGKNGRFEYTLEGGERWIDKVFNDDGTFYEEDKDEDIYGEIHDWVNENIEWDTIIKWKGKEVKF